MLCEKCWLSLTMRAIKKEFILTTNPKRSCKQRVLTTVLWGFTGSKWQDEELRTVVEHIVTLSPHYKIELDLLLGCVSIKCFKR